MNAIYKPSGKAREYASLACNLYTGCLHNCSYCFNKFTPWHNKIAWAAPKARPGILEALHRDATKYSKAGITDEILLCFTCDPYQGQDSLNHITASALGIIAAHGLRATILTKGGSKAYRDFSIIKKAGFSFGTSLSFMRNEEAKIYEPGAASPSDRIAVIKSAHASGIRTWVSIEPVIEPYQALAIIETTRSHVMEFKIGPLNHTEEIHKFNWAWFMREAIAAAEGTPIMFKQEAYNKL